MTDIERNALALLNEVATRLGITALYEAYPHELANALCRAIEQHEAFRQEVSDALEGQFIGGIPDKVRPFIIPKRVDPLVEVLSGMYFSYAPEDAKALRAALAARGLKITQKKEQN